jgi:glycosyltransferase involved in cell wall biosynthesis
LRILFTKQFPLDAPGGETSHLFALAHQMRAMGVEVYLMPVTNHPTPPGIWPAEFIREVRPVGIHRVFDSISISKAAANFVKETPVDAVLSWQYETAFLPNFSHSQGFVHGVVAAAPFGLLKRKTFFNPLRALIFNFFHFRMLRVADIIFCPSNFSKEELVEFIGIDPSRIVVSHLGADDVFQPLRTPKSGSISNFIFAGSFKPIKGIFDVIEALAIIHQRGYTDWTLKIAGWGNFEVIMKIARKRGIDDHLLHLGSLDRPTLAAELANSDLAILPSHIDNFGLSIAEAQACGLPVVSYRVGGIPEEVDEGQTAILVDLYDYAKLADAIIFMIDHPAAARKMGKKGQQFIRDHFSWKKAASEMLSTISAIKIEKCRGSKKE